MRWWPVTAMMILTVPAPASAQRAAAAAERAPAYTFSYAYPAAAARIAPLRRWLDTDRARFRAEVAKDAEADRRERRAGDVPFHAHEGTRTWKVVTETPRLLSLSGETYRFTGGAHGGTTLQPLLWDRKRARRVDPRALFVSPDALQRVWGATWCARLKAERMRRLGGDAPGDDIFPCPPISELTLLLGSTNRDAIDRIGLIAGQYVAGSYAEGMYEVTLPVTPELLRVVRPEWRGVFAVGGR